MINYSSQVNIILVYFFWLSCIKIKKLELTRYIYFWFKYVIHRRLGSLSIQTTFASPSRWFLGWFAYVVNCNDSSNSVTQVRFYVFLDHLYYRLSHILYIIRTYPISVYCNSQCILTLGSLNVNGFDNIQLFCIVLSRSIKDVKHLFPQ